MDNESFFGKFKRKAFSVNTFDNIMDVSGERCVDVNPSRAIHWLQPLVDFPLSGGTMKRKLRGWQLLLLGVGTMVGAGVFVSTGSAAQDKAG